jgi:hypothetical protein
LAVNSDQTNFVLARNERTISGQIRRRLGRDIQEELDEQTGGISLPPDTVLAANLENALDEALNRDDAKLTLTSRLIFADALQQYDLGLVSLFDWPTSAPCRGRA